MPQFCSAPQSVLLGLTGLRIEGGIASVGRCVVRALEESAKAGVVARIDRVLLLDDPAQAAPGSACGDQEFSRGSQLRFAWQVWRGFRRSHHDLVFFDFVGLARAILTPLPGFPPRRYVIFLHGGELARAVPNSRLRALRGAQRVLTNSRFTADLARDRFPEISDRLCVVPLCVDPDKMTLWEVAIDSHTQREPAVLIVGRMWAEERGKGHDQLIAAWPAVRAAIPDAVLWIVGDGDDRKRIMARARMLGVDDSVRFFGRLSDAELGSLYRRASLFAMPSRQEGFGLVYLEAMLNGLPCLGSTADAAGQVIVDGKTGILVPYGDVDSIATGVKSILSKPEAAARMGENGRRHVLENFTYSQFRTSLLSALELPGLP